MIENFAGKTAVLTGAGSGFGLECARIGARLGMNLVLVDVQQDALDAATAEMQAAGAQVLAKAVRRHWAVENELHWSLDVGFREDACQVRKDHAPANLACIRRMALTQLKQETTKKLGIQGKRRRAGWDQTYMQIVLRGAVSI